jgi:hypothetical protein
MPIFETGVFHRLATAGSFKSGPFLSGRRFRLSDDSSGQAASSFILSTLLTATKQRIRKEFPIFR